MPIGRMQPDTFVVFHQPHCKNPHEKLPSLALLVVYLYHSFPVLLFAAKSAARPNDVQSGGLPTGCPKSDMRCYFLVFDECD